MARKKRRKAWTEYPLRRCYSMHSCALCGETIRLGEMYYDGGYGRRVHEVCVFPPEELNKKEGG